MSQTTKQRLSRDAWITAGFKALAIRGPEALKAEPLARDLGTTKGSFYWHFKDVPDYQSALLDTWEGKALPAEDEGGLPVPRLRRLAGWLGEANAEEAALRAWAKGGGEAARAVTRVDARRLEQISALLREIGIANPEMARILYAAGVGMREMQDSASAPGTDAMGSLVDLILALR